MNVVMDVLVVCLVFLLGPFVAVRNAEVEIPHIDVSNWAIKFGSQMWQMGKQATRIQQIKERYQAEARVERVDGLAMVKDMAEEMENMMGDKIEAIKRIMDGAEQLSISHPNEIFERGRGVAYYNAKRLNSYNPFGPGAGKLKDGFKEVIMSKGRHFGDVDVNITLSAVHVPTNVYDGASDVMNAIQWSEKLNRIFVTNYESDPSLGWQYFGSSTGFMRQYPATVWEHDEMDPDLFDCRLRPWYLQAAASAKDMIILVDTSGSMTGVRKEIAKQVVLTLLDTLGENDFVNIYSFAETPEAIVPCFRDKLVQANLENLRELKLAMEQPTMANIANFSSAFSTAFEILAHYNQTGQGSQCNQVIMLVTDGAPRNYDEVFKTYNWPQKLVRLFTYVIGREIIDTTATKEIACNNKGYFVRVTSLAEVREQVLKYIPVLSRPMVMYQQEHPIMWTPVYVDVAEPKLSDWLWEIRERRRQKERSLNYRQLSRLSHKEQNQGEVSANGTVTPATNRASSNVSMAVLDRYLSYGVWLLNDEQMAAHQMRLDREKRDRTKPKYRMVTSVSTPVFDRKNFSNIIERMLINDAVWVEKTRTVRTANLLGVAGTDIPIAELKKRSPAYKLGANGYSFLVNNNGYILFHPDFRPLDKDILKPNYNTVDLFEVELVDSDGGPRENDTSLFMMRREMIEQRQGEMMLRVRVHCDDMKRASVRRQRYYYRGLKGTPFSLGLALPDGYGHFRVVAETEIKRVLADHNINVSSFFSGKNWKVHPDWVYCRYNYDHIKTFASPEAEVLHFVDRTQRERWRWNSKHVRPTHDGTRSHSFFNKPEENYYCDKHLMQSLIFDAQATEVFDKNNSLRLDRQEPHAMFQLFGISIAFVATRSGLLRWQDIASIHEQYPDEYGHFSEANIKAIDQTWYKRAVDHYEVDPESFVYSVPFDAGILNESLVTASHAIFVEKEGHRAPAAVVGLQYKNSVFRETFFNITSLCTGGVPCKRSCSVGDMACYVLDNNGYVVISKDIEQTGRFFGEIDGTIMDSLVYYEVYQRIRVYDYQAVCLDHTGYTGSSNMLLTPFKFMKWAVHWAIGRATWLLLQTQLAQLINPEWAWSLEQEQPDYADDDDASAFNYPGVREEEGDKVYVYLEDGLTMESAYINKTRPRPCDKQMDLYSLQADRLFEKGRPERPRAVKGRLANCNANSFTRQCGRTFSIHKIPHSNLVLLVIDTTCKCETRRLSVDPQEVFINESLRCERPQESLFRLRPSTCKSYHPEEEAIKLCGRGSVPVPSVAVSILLTVSTLYYTVSS